MANIVKNDQSIFNINTRIENDKIKFLYNLIISGFARFLWILIESQTEKYASIDYYYNLSRINYNNNLYLG